MREPFFQQCDLEPEPGDPLVADINLPVPLPWGSLRHCVLPDPPPRPLTFRLHEHRSAYGFWLDAKGKAELPPAEMIDPTGFAGALGCVLLLEPEQSGRDFRYRIYGSRIAQMFGQDMTGRLLSEFPEVAARNTMRQYHLVMQTRRAIYSEHDAVPEASLVIRWCRLVLPFVDRMGVISRLLVANVPVERPVLEAMAR